MPHVYFCHLYYVKLWIQTIILKCFYSTQQHIKCIWHPAVHLRNDFGLHQFWSETSDYSASEMLHHLHQRWIFSAERWMCRGCSGLFNSCLLQQKLMLWEWELQTQRTVLCEVRVNSRQRPQIRSHQQQQHQLQIITSADKTCVVFVRYSHILLLCY